MNTLWTQAATNICSANSIRTAILLFGFNWRNHMIKTNTYRAHNKTFKVFGQKSWQMCIYSDSMVTTKTNSAIQVLLTPLSFYVLYIYLLNNLTSRTKYAILLQTEFSDVLLHYLGSCHLVQQVNILISKTRHCKCYALNIMYIKLHKLLWIRN